MPRPARRPIHPPPTTAVRALPIPVPLIAGERAAAYLARLARANHLPVRVLENLLARRSTARNVIDMPALAALGDVDIDHLRRALGAPPAWPSSFLIQRLACSHCLARRGVVSTVLITVAQTQPLCRRHRRWLAQPAWPDSECDLSALPEILRAQRQHRQLAHHYRHLLAMSILFDEAERWIKRQPPNWPGARRISERLDRLQRSSHPSHPPAAHHPIWDMLRYPEVVSAARLMARAPDAT